MGKSVSAWVRDEHIAIDLEYAIELADGYAIDEDSGVNAAVLIDGGESYRVYDGLDWLCISEGLFCNINVCDDEEVNVIGKNHYLYLMDCYALNGSGHTGIIKVGVSRFPKRRAEQLSEAWKRKGIRFSVRVVSKGSWSKRKTYITEGCIHNVLRHKGLQYDAGCKYDGFSELFYDKDWIESLI